MKQYRKEKLFALFSLTAYGENRSKILPFLSERSVSLVKAKRQTCISPISRLSLFRHAHCFQFLSLSPFSPRGPVVPASPFSPLVPSRPLRPGNPLCPGKPGDPCKHAFEFCFALEIETRKHFVITEGRKIIWICSQYEWFLFSILHWRKIVENQETDDFYRS